MSDALPLHEIRCLALAVSGTNGKSTTARLIERILLHNQRRTAVFGQEAQPLSSAVSRSSELDYLILQLDSFELRHTELLRPAAAVLLNVWPGQLDVYGEADRYIQAYAALFKNQQFFDWAIIESQALEQLHRLNVSVPAKVITFSAVDQKADLFLDRGLLLSRLPNWPGPLLDLDHALLRGPHNAENLMAALAVGHVLRLPLESMVDALKTFQSGPHRCEVLGEINGVQFINDAKSCNLDAMQGAIKSSRTGVNGEPNIWLIAGGDDTNQDFHALGPLLSQRVKGVFLIGKESQKIRQAWSLFTPCNCAASLLEAVAEAAKSAASGDVVLLSPACPGLDQFRNYQHRGQEFCDAVKSIGGGGRTTGPHMSGVSAYSPS